MAVVSSGTPSLERARRVGNDFEGERDDIGFTPAPALSVIGTGRVYFDSVLSKYRASENGGVFVDLIAGGGTLDDAYNFGGAGLGSDISITTGKPVLIEGTDDNPLDILRVRNTDAGVSAVSSFKVGNDKSGSWVFDTDTFLEIAQYSNAHSDRAGEVWFRKSKATGGQGTIMGFEHDSGNGSFHFVANPTSGYNFRFNELSAGLTVSNGVFPNSFGGAARTVFGSEISDPAKANIILVYNTSNTAGVFTRISAITASGFQAASLRSDAAASGNAFAGQAGLELSGTISAGYVRVINSIPLDFYTTNTKRFTLLTGSNTIQGNAGLFIEGGAAAGNDLTLSSTSNATKGSILFGNSAYDEVNNRLGIGTITASTPLEISGAGNQFLRVTSTDDSQTGIEFFRPDNADTDWRILNDGGSLFIKSSGDDFASTSPKMAIRVGGNALLDPTTVDISLLQLRIIRASNTAAQGMGIGFVHDTSNGNVGAAIIHERVGSTSQGKLHFATKGSTVASSDIPIRMTIDENGIVSTIMGTSGSFSNVGGIADSQFTNVGNVGAGEDTLQTFTLPANALNANGKAIRIRAVFRTAQNGNVKTIKLHFGGTIIGSSGAAALDNRTITFDVVVVRTAASAQRSMALRVEGVDGLFADNTLIRRTFPAEDTTAAIVIKGTGEGVANDDVIQESMLVEFLN